VNHSALKVLMLAIAVMLVGCRTAPRAVYEVERVQVVASRALSMDEVEKAIRAGGISAGWQMVTRGPGNMEGIYVLREHRAVVSVAFDTTAFSIKYKDSVNMRFDGTGVSVHYNNWVQSLERGIRAQWGSL
jgi:hypothetical protein